MSVESSTVLQRFAQHSCAWSERWIPDAFIFAAIAVVVVALAVIGLGAAPVAVAKAFGDGFWSLNTFTMQMCFVFIGGYALASSPPVAGVVRALARVPGSGRGAVCWVATVSMALSLAHWALSLIVGSLLVRELARRHELRMDYCAAGAAAYLGLGSVWAMGLSSSAAQLQANPASMPPGLLQISGVLPFSQTLFLWQSVALTAVLIGVTLLIVWLSAPGPQSARTAEVFTDLAPDAPTETPSHARRPGEWLEYNPLLSLLLGLLGIAWLVQEFAHKGPAQAISSLNAYNFLFWVMAILMCWRPRHFLDAATRAVPGVAGVLIQFPLYGGIATMMTAVPGADGQPLAHHIAELFSSTMTRESFPVLIGLYSALLGFFIPSGGGKWIIEAPYVMQAANDLQVHLGWAVQVYNAAEALPNLINPFWMLPLLGLLKLQARDIVGFTILQFIAHLPLVLLMLWLFGLTLPYVPPVIP